MINELQKHMVPGIGTGDNPLAARFWDVRNANAHRGGYNVKDVRNCVARMENTDGNPVVCVFSDAIFPQQKSGTDLRETKCDRRLSNITHAIRTYVEGSFEATAAARWLRPLLDIEGRQD
jgi:hypothetical protein